MRQIPRPSSFSTSPLVVHHNIAPATATPSAPITPFPKAGIPCTAALVLCALALLPVAAVEPPEIVLDPVLPAVVDVEPPVTDAPVVLAAAPELPVCFAFADPAVMITGM